MKNISIVLNIVLAIAVAVLYYLHFKPTQKSINKLTPGDLKNMHIAFVNSDSLLEHYDFFIKTRKTLKDEEEQNANYLNGQAAGLQKEFEDAQSRVSSMTTAQAQATQENLQRKQQTLLQRKEEMQDAYGKKLQNMNDLLTDKIHDYLKKYNQEKNFDYILGYQKGSGILYAKDELDVTNEVLSGMNEEYKKEKK
jgi:outer membrane protein